MWRAVPIAAFGATVAGGALAALIALAGAPDLQPSRALSSGTPALGPVGPDQSTGTT